VKFSNRTVGTQTIRKHILLLSTLALLLGSWLFMYYFKTEKKIASYKNQIKTIEKQQQEFSSKTQPTHLLKKNIRSLKNSLKTSVPTNDVQKDRITSIARRIQKLGLKLNSCTVQPIQNKKWRTKQTVTYNISGQPRQIEKLIKKIQKKETNIKCKKFLLSTNQDQQTVELVLQFMTPKKNITV